MENYNGYSNYETWNVALWFNNEEALYNDLKHLNYSSDIKTYVLDRFNASGAFGDLTSQEQIDKVDFNELILALKSH